MKIRNAVRALVVTPQWDVLLVRFEFPSGTRWALPGGGIETGEGPEAALTRELNEEIGLAQPKIGKLIWTREHMIPLFDNKWDGQRELIFQVEVPQRFNPTPAMTPTELQSESLHEVRWWSFEEIVSESTIVFVPRSLSLFPQQLADDGLPDNPIDVGV